MKTINRIAQFIDYKGISLNSFDERIEASNGYIGKQIKREASIGSDVLERIASNFPELNMTWLIVGEGSMIKEPPLQGVAKIPTFTEESLTHKLYNELLSAKDKIIHSQEETINALKRLMN